MFRKNKITKSSIVKTYALQGETIEEKIRRIVNNKEPITDGAPIIHTQREEGVNPAYDIRTDRFEIAVDAMDAVTRSHLAKRDMSIGERTYDTMTPEKQKEFNTKYPNNKHNIKQLQDTQKNKGEA